MARHRLHIDDPDGDADIDTFTTAETGPHFSGEAAGLALGVPAALYAAGPKAGLSDVIADILTDLSPDIKAIAAADENASGEAGAAAETTGTEAEAPGEQQPPAGDEAVPGEEAMEEVADTPASAETASGATATTPSEPAIKKLVVEVVFPEPLAGTLP